MDTKNYLMINPFNPQEGNGINAYYQNLRLGVDDDLTFHTLSNNHNEPLDVFRRTVSAYVKEHFSPDNVIIEAPETRASTILLDRSYKVHVRLHTPVAICHKYEKKETSQARLSDELRAIAQAAVVTAPSYGIKRELENFLDASRFVVNKNPIFKRITNVPWRARMTDVIFMGRHQTLKGSQFIDLIRAYLPEKYHFHIVGKGMLKHPIAGRHSPTTTISDHIQGDGRFESLANSRVAIIPSLFENCSMMMLEALAANVPVVSWKVGGNDEFPSDLVKTIPFDRVENFVRAIIDTLEDIPTTPERFSEAIHQINNDFRHGFRNMLEIASSKTSKPYLSPFVPQPAHIPKSPKLELPGSEDLFVGKRILGFTISNEHIEELWLPLLNYSGIKYEMVCKRPLGFRKLWSHPYPVPSDTFSQYDWVSDPDTLISQIRKFEPHALLTHNGSHPIYKNALEKIKALQIPIIYTELGWFPQTDHVYLDRWGVNGGSSLAAMDYFSITDDYSPESDEMPIIESKDILLAVQLDNDTNLKVFSPRFRSADSFVQHIVSGIPDGYRVIIKPHPLDRQATRFEALRSHNVDIVGAEIPISNVLSTVGHVVAINSTVLLQALEYPVNIYAGGQSIINNKGIAIELKDRNFCDVFTPRLKGSIERRNNLIAAFRSRQANVVEFGNRSLVEEGTLDPALLPLAESILLSPVHAASIGASSPHPGATIKMLPTTKPTATPLPSVKTSSPSLKTTEPLGVALSAEPVLKKNKVSDSKKTKPTSALKEARLAMKTKDFRKAALFFKTVVEGNPKPNVYREAAEVYDLIGDKKRAIRCLHLALNKSPDNVNIRRRIKELQRPNWLRSISFLKERRFTRNLNKRSIT